MPLPNSDIYNPNFKEFSDVYGFAAGDKLLLNDACAEAKKVAKAMKGSSLFMDRRIDSPMRLKIISQTCLVSERKSSTEFNPNG